MIDESTSTALSLARTGLLAVVLVAAMGTANIRTAHAQDASEDLTSLSLEELMDLEIVPIGILESHIHLDGQFMIGYRYMRMSMSGHAESDPSYMMNPTSMWMDMHMVMVMYGLTDDLTLMAMLPYRQSVMDMTDAMGMRMTAASDGIGDVLLTGHYALLRRRSSYVIGGAGLTIPTGSIEASSNDRRLGYGMQRGAGVPEFTLDLNAIHQSDRLNAGMHVQGQWSLGHNRNGYRLGDRYHSGAWVTIKTARWFAPSLHLDAEHSLGISGADAGIMRAMSPANDPNSYGGTHVSLSPGVTIYAPGGWLAGQRLTFTLEYPLYNRHPAHFLEKEWALHSGWQWTF